MTLQVLGLTKACSEKDIKQAYRKLALEHHPDKLGANATEEDQQRFMEVRPRSAATPLPLCCLSSATLL